MQHKHTPNLLQKIAGGAALTAMLIALAPMSHAAPITVAQLTTTGGQNIAGGETVQYTLEFDPITALAQGESIDLTFPAGFDISAASATATNLGGEITASSSSVALQVLTVDLDTVSAPFTDLTTIVIDDVVTPDVATIDTITIDTPSDTGSVTVNVGLNASVTPDNTAVDATGVTYAFTITGLPALDEDDVIRLTFPNGDPVLASNIDLSSAATTVNSGLTGTVSENIVTVGGNYIDLTLDAAATIAGGATALELEVANLVNPSGAGIHGIGIDIFDEGSDALAQGIANAGIGNSVQITAIITEALIMTLSGNAVTLQVDPAVNDGQDLSESTTINVFSNAASGYTLHAYLDDGTGESRLVDGNGNDIPSGSNAGAGDNYLGYTATNNLTPNATAAVNAFPDDQGDTVLYVGDAGSQDTPLSASDTTDPVAAPGNGGEHTVNYDLNVSFLTPAGVYTGTIFYTVVANF